MEKFNQTPTNEESLESSQKTENVSDVDEGLQFITSQLELVDEKIADIDPRIHRGGPNAVVREITLSPEEVNQIDFETANWKEMRENLNQELEDYYSTRTNQLEREVKSELESALRAVLPNALKGGSHRFGILRSNGDIDSQIIDYGISTEVFSKLSRKKLEIMRSLTDPDNKFTEAEFTELLINPIKNRVIGSLEEQSLGVEEAVLKESQGSVEKVEYDEQSKEVESDVDDLSTVQGVSSREDVRGSSENTQPETLNETELATLENENSERIKETLDQVKFDVLKDIFEKILDRYGININATDSVHVRKFIERSEVRSNLTGDARVDAAKSIAITKGEIVNRPEQEFSTIEPVIEFNPLSRAFRAELQAPGESFPIFPTVLKCIIHEEVHATQFSGKVEVPNTDESSVTVSGITEQVSTIRESDTGDIDMETGEKSHTLLNEGLVEIIADKVTNEYLTRTGNTEIIGSYYQAYPVGRIILELLLQKISVATGYSREVALDNLTGMSYKGESLLQGEFNKKIGEDARNFLKEYQGLSPDTPDYEEKVQKLCAEFVQTIDMQEVEDEAILAFLQKRELLSQEDLGTSAEKFLEKTRDLTLGPDKTMGYVMIDDQTKVEMFHSVAELLEARGNKAMIIGPSDSHFNFPVLFTWNEQYLQELIDKNADVIKAAGWSTTPEAFVKRVANESVESSSELFDLVADAFGDKKNPGRTDISNEESRYTKIESIDPNNLTGQEKEFVDFLRDARTIEAKIADLDKQVKQGKLTSQESIGQTNKIVEEYKTEWRRFNALLGEDRATGIENGVIEELSLRKDT